jgi:hypothetical protein
MPGVESIERKDFDDRKVSVRKRAKRAIIASQKRDASRGSPRSLAALGMTGVLAGLTACDVAVE